MIEVFTVSAPPLGENSYLIFNAETKEALIIDPGSDPDQILYLIKSNHLNPKAIFNTHGHFDHICYNDYLRNKLNIHVYAHPLSDENRINASTHGRMFGITIEPQSKTDDITQQTILLGDEVMTIFHTPGHSTGSISIYFPESKLLFSGDTLFRGNVGRTDLPGGDLNILKESVLTLFKLPKDTVIYPGLSLIHI